jgi:inorganic triphosphatase YgiF
MPVEVELKYRAAGPAVLRRLETVGGLGPASLGPAQRTDETDRYLDTPDGRLAAARWACRLRSRDGTTRLSLKGPPERGTADALHRRPELEGPAEEGLDPAGWPASEARALLDRLRAGRPLVERFQLDQQRTERPVLLDGVELGTLTLDVVQVRHRGRPRGVLHAVELELSAARPPADDVRLGELDTALTAVDGVEPDDRTKLEHALDLLPDR